MIPKTAGRFITEDQVYSFLRCPKIVFHYKDILPAPQRMLLNRRIYEEAVARAFRNEALYITPDINVEQIIMRHTRALPMFATLMEPEQKALLRKIRLDVFDMLHKVSFTRYRVLSPAQEYTVKVAKTPIRLRISALVREKRPKVVQAIVTSPFQKKIDVLNDPLLALKVSTMTRMTRMYAGSRRLTVVGRVHVFYYKGDEVQYLALKDADITKAHLKSIRRLIESMQIGLDYPSTPCYEANCKYRNVCNPGNT